MAVTSFKRIHSGRSGEDSIDARGKSVVRYTDIYRVATDSNYTEAEDIAQHPLCPQLGQAHPRDPQAFCRSRRIDNEPFSKRVWLVTVGYSSENEVDIDPTAEPARITWRSERYQVPVEKDNNGVAHTNTAGDPFDPPALMDRSRWIATVRKNLSVVPTWLLEYCDAVNDADFTLDGLVIPKGWAKLDDLEIGDWQSRNNVYYRTVVLGISIEPLQDTTGILKWDSTSSSYVALGATEYEFARAVITLNAGLYQKSGGNRVPCTDSNGDAVTAPMLLAADGSQLALPANPDDAKYVASRVYQEKDFSILPLL